MIEGFEKGDKVICNEYGAKHHNLMRFARGTVHSIREVRKEIKVTVKWDGVLLCGTRYSEVDSKALDKAGVEPAVQYVR